MKICVIGAGPAGLTTIKQLRDEGHEVVCFEKNADLGGIWYRHEGDEDQPKAYDSLVLTISMRLMCFSDLMVESRRFVDHKGYLRYLRAYADKFHLREWIKFNTSVDRVERTASGEWRVEVTSNGKKAQHVFGAVALCSGPFRTPDMDVTRLNEFQGEVLHSSRYRNNTKYRGKRVLVVGLAESGADVLREISDVTSACTLSVRSRSFLIPRLFSGKVSTDEITFRALQYEVFVRATEAPFRMASMHDDGTVSREDFLAATRLCGLMLLASTAVVKESEKPETISPDALNNLGQPMLPLKLDLNTEYTQQHIDLIYEWNVKSHKGQGNYTPRAIFSKNVCFIPNIANGKIQVDDSGIKDIRGKSVHFNDGTVKEFDAIVCCTGFKPDFSMMANVEVPGNNVRNLYKHAFHPDVDGRFAVIGWVRPYSGGIPICAEMQARYFALLCNDKIKLPADVKKRIADDKAYEEFLTEFSPRHYDAIPAQILFLDSIAKEIGCLPTSAEIIKQPALLTKLWFSSFTQACYRLVGPHAMPEMALKEVMSELHPGRSATMIAGMIASSTLPTEMHKKDAHVPEFPAVLPKEEEQMILGAFEQIISQYIKT